MVVIFDRFLETREIANGLYELLSEFVVFINTPSKTVVVTVPAGFITDYASVPRIPFAYLLFGGLGNYAAVLHDGLYSDSTKVTIVDYDTKLPYPVTRAWSDDVFFHGLQSRGIESWKSYCMYAGVRLKGGRYYKRK